jgi:hypothetical protein
MLLKTTSLVVIGAFFYIALCERLEAQNCMRYKHVLRPMATEEREPIIKVTEIREIPRIKPMKYPRGLQRNFRLERQYVFIVGPGGQIIIPERGSTEFKRTGPSMNQVIVDTGETYYMDDVQTPLAIIEGPTGPCAFGVFYNCKTKKTLAVHSYGFEYQSFFDVLPTLSEKIGDDRINIVVYIGGNAVIYDENSVTRDELKFLRLSIEERNGFIKELKRHGYSNIITAFPKQIEIIFDTMFDPQTGLFSIFEMTAKYPEYPPGGRMDIEDYLKWLAAVTLQGQGPKLKDIKKIPGADI